MKHSKMTNEEVSVESLVRALDIADSTISDIDKALQQAKAVKQHNDDVIESLVNQRLLTAVYNNSVKEAKKSLELGADVNTQSRLALRIAIENNALDMVTLLVEWGTHISTLSTCVFNPFVAAEALSDTKILDYLNKVKELGNRKVYSTQASLMVNQDILDVKLCEVAQDGHLPAVKRLIQLGAEPHVGYDYPLCVAVIRGHWDIVRYLVEDCGVDAAVQGCKPLVFAAEKKDPVMLDYLIKHCGVYAKKLGDYSLTTYVHCVKTKQIGPPESVNYLRK